MAHELLSNDKKHLVLFENGVKIDKTLPKYKVVNEVNGIKNRPSFSVTPDGNSSDGPDVSVINYDTLKKFLLEEDNSITDFNVTISEKMRNIISGTHVRGGIGQFLNSGEVNRSLNNYTVVGNGQQTFWKALRDLFRWKKKTTVNTDEGDEKKDIVGKEFDVVKFFADVKLTLEESKRYENRIAEYIKCIGLTEKSGQAALKEKLFEQLVLNKYESYLFSKGYYKSLTEETLVKLAENCDKSLKLTYLANYIRHIPLSVINKKMEIDGLEVFDNYAILSYGDTNEIEQLTNEEKKKYADRAKDPILFGLISGSKRLYYITDWVEKDDDLTLDKVIEILGKDVIEADYLSEKIDEA